jgi:FtsZ-binding cell division protein ZapB
MSCSICASIVLMAIIISIGEIQYRQRLEDIRLLKLEIKKLRREKGILTKNVANIEDLRYTQQPDSFKSSWIHETTLFPRKNPKTCMILFQT